MAVNAVRLIAYVLFNITSSTCIVFANKTVLTTFGFKFPYTLMLLHATFTWLGIELAGYLGLFPRKSVPRAKVLPIAIAFVAFVVFGNVNLQMNTVSFYQITKIAVPPAVLFFEFSLFGKQFTLQKLCAVAVVCGGVWMATVTDPEVSMTLANAGIGAGAVISAAAFQILAGREQTALGLSSLQLLQEYSPLAVGILSVLVPCVENMGWMQADRTPATVAGFPYTFEILMAICFSTSCGLMVILSSFLVIGSTSPLTYNIIGHSKTIIVLAGGALLFGDNFTQQKILGVAVAFAGIVWYSLIGIVCPVNDQKASSTMSTTTSKSPRKPAVKPLGTG